MSTKNSTPEQLVEALHRAFGTHRDRAVHAKGIVLTGTFAPSAEASELTIAPHLQRVASAITLRFSNFTGTADIPDNVGDANPRGLALRFTLSDGRATDIVAHSFNGFPTKSATEFRELLLALSRPTALETFLETHPIARRFLTTQKSPASYATSAYFGVNAFRFTNAAGFGNYVRYQFVPDAGERYLDAVELAARGPSFLREDLVARLTRDQVRFTLFAQLAGPGDVVEDPSQAWPTSRVKVPLGTLRLDALAPQDVDRAIAFDPTSLLPGIEIADPMLSIRSRSYLLSARRRR